VSAAGGTVLQLSGGGAAEPDEQAASAKAKIPARDDRERCCMSFVTAGIVTPERVAVENAAHRTVADRGDLAYCRADAVLFAYRRFLLFRFFVGRWRSGFL
jgi:hypothetical protein